jgi:hypothetical protein
MKLELVPINDIKDYEDNPKEGLGAAYKKALDKSLENFDWKGTLILTPRCDKYGGAALGERFGYDNKFIVADGNKRLERLKQSGYRWVLVIPGGHSDAHSTEELVAGILAGAEDVKDALKNQVRPGEKVAIGTVYGDLNTPARVMKFVLTFDRAKAKYDEGMVQTAIRDLIEVGEDPADLEALTTVKLAMVMDLISKEEVAASQKISDWKAEAKKAISEGREAPPSPESPEARLAEKKAARAQLRALVGPFSLSMDQQQKFGELMDELRNTIPEKLLKVLEMARDLGVADDIEFGAAIERAFRVHKEDLAA